VSYRVSILSIATASTLIWLTILAFPRIRSSLEPATVETPDDLCWGTGLNYNIPMPDGYFQADVVNPKIAAQ
jgi:hypothetical protein